MSRPAGRVYLVGAGPGDPELISVRGRRLLRRADVVVCDRLVARELLKLVRRDAEIVDAGKSCGQHRLTQDEINALLVARARSGATVVRLKGGDPFVFGRGGEEAAACRDAGIPYGIVPGVSSPLAAPLAAGIPVTERSVARSFAVITGHAGDRCTPLEHDFAALARIDTLVVCMGKATADDWVARLIAGGRSAHTPAAAIASATTPAQRVWTGRLEELPGVLADRDWAGPVVSVVGEVVRSARPAAGGGGLAGRRVWLTGTGGLNRRLALELRLHGALPVIAPLIRVVPPRDTGPLHTALTHLAAGDWLAFTSRYAVLSFWQALDAKHADARALAGCKIAAVGTGTARALARRGLRADLIAHPATGAELADALLDEKPVPRRVLHPRSDRARPAFAERLRSAGVTVDDPIAYRTVTSANRALLDETGALGCDCIVLASPSAAHALHRLNVVSAHQVLVAIGPTTAAAARELGLPIAAVAEAPHAAALVAALAAAIDPVGVSP
jgi:uroporphyrinogen III methyltransferase/synthase